MKKYFSMLLLTLGMLAFGIPAVAQGSNDIATGYYYVYKSESQALTNINLGLKWDPLQRGNAAFIFHLEKAETGDDEYWMQSLVDGSWFYGVTNYYVTEFRANEADKATIRFTPIADQEGRYGIRPTKSRPDLTGDNDIHNYFQTTGSRKEGGVFAGGPNDYHPLAQWSADAWIVEQVPANELATAKLRVALVKAIEEYQNAYHFTAGAEGLITNASDGDDRTGAGSQFFTTCQVGDSYSSIKNLIDGDLNTCFQSTWNADQAEAPQWLQVDAGKEVEGFRLQIGLRNGDWGSAEMWQDVTLYATNDEAAATNAEIATIDDVKANAAWTRIGEYNFSTEKSLAFGNGNWGLQMIKGVAEATDRIQTKDFLLQGKKYRYLRFYVNQTMNPQSDNKDFTLGELQIFEIANPVAEASLAPKAAKLAVLIASSEQLIANGSATEADVDALVKATNATPEDFGMFSTGYYYIYKNDAQALTNINLGLKWDPLQRGNAAFIFRLEKAEGADDEYWMQSLVDDSWFYGVTNYYVTEFRADEADKATIRFTPLADNDGYYGIRPTTSRPDLTGDNDIHNYFQTTGSRQTSFSGTTNDYHPLAQWSAEAWRVEKVSESELAAAKLRIALVKAIEASQNAYSYTAASEGLITSANDGDDRTGAGSQFFTTCQVGDSYSSIKNLIDGDLNTCFQSTWNAGQAEAPQWLQVDAGKEVEGFRLQIGLRNGDWGSAEMWQDITLYATNDEAAATNAEIATIDDVKANAAWTRIGEYNFSTEKSLALGDGNWGFQMVKAIAEATDRYQTKDFVFNGKKYRYLRFYVNQTMNPQSDNKDFTLGELQIFEIANPAVSSAYADKVDALNQLIEKAEKTLAAGTGATESDVEALIEATKEVTVASAATLVSTFDKAKPLVTNVDQLSANAIQVGDGGGLAALIDGNLATHFHSAYNSNNGSTLPDAKQYLQVDLSATPVNQIYFTLNGRSGGYHDTPTDITVLASNDGEEWTEVTQLENIIDGNPADAYVAQYVDLKSTYKYVRFVVDRSTQGRTVAVNGNTYYFWNATEFQVYAAEEVNVALQAAYQLYGSEKDYDTDGTDPGYYSAEKKAEFEATMAEVRSTATGIIPNEQAESLAQKLNDALAALQSSLIEVTDGYYSFINAFPTFEANQGVKKAITANDANLTWGTYDEADPAYLFKVTKLEDGSYSVQNVKNNKYINTVPGRSAVVPVSDEQVTGQIFTLIAGTVQFNLANTANAESYHPAGHSGGDGISGNIVGYPGGANTQSAWYVHKITDEAEIAELIDKAEKAQSSAKLNDLIQQAWAAVHDAGEALITNATDGDEACQFSSNAKESREGSYAALIDNNIATFFHSVWSAAGPETPHNLQIDLGQKAQVLNYTFTSRGSGNHDVPYVFNILATNSDELGANAESADDEWTLIAEVEDKTIPNINGFVYNNTIDLGSQYRYVRFVVLNTTDQVNGRVNSTTGQPYFNLSEFQIYANTENSDYAASQEVKTAVDELNALILADVAKVANLEAKNEDVEALAAALDKAKSIIAEVKEQRSQEQVNTDLADAIKAANEALATFGEEMVADASQFSSNAQSNGDDSSFAHLLDDDLHYTHNFHTVWNAAHMQNDDETEEAWNAFLTEYYGKEVGTGYHNLQVALNEAVEAIQFNYVSRTGTAYTDNPNKIDVYVTNDATLGASTNNAELDQWTKVAELTEGFPADGQGLSYTSPVINFGDTYKYIRFVVKGTTHQGTVAARTFKHPEITGVTFNISKFQVYGRTANSDYNQYAAVKTAADELASLVVAANEKLASGVASADDVAAINAALASLENTRAEISADLTEAVKAAEAAYALAGEEMLTDASQFSSNAQSNGDDSSFAHLLDDDLHYTHNFHTVWNAAHMQNDDETEEAWNAYLTEYYGKEVGTGYHNLQVALNDSVDAIQFNYVSRTGTAYTDNPNKIDVYVTNDATLGASTNNAELDQWTKVAELTEGFPADGQGLSYTSPVINFGDTYKYIRFVVKGTTHQGTVAARTFKHPEITGVTFNISKFQVYAKTENSGYAKNDEIKSAADKLEALIADAKAKIEAGTATNADITALQAATAELDGIRSIYDDLKPLKDQLADAIVEAEKARERAVVVGELVTDGAQISSNSHSVADSHEEGFSHLLDNDKTTVFHSVWSGAFGDDTNVPTEGTGYHNVQFRLNEAVNKFYFTYVGVGNTTYHDSPDNITIYATNDDALGASTDAADSEKWTYVKNLHKDFPEDVEFAEYQSPMIYLNGDYKYIRLVINHTTHTEAVPARHFSAPDVTGITWNLSELHVFGGEALEASPYYTVEGLKDAVDVLDDYVLGCLSKLGKAELTAEDIQELKDATQKVNDLLSAGEDPDKTEDNVNGGNVDAVKALSAEPAEKLVNVYSIDGKLVKKNVKASEAKEGLSSGIYLIGKKKVSVK